MTKKVLLVVASHGFQPNEYHETKQELEKANIQVVTASNKPGTAIDHDGNTVTVDVEVSSVNPQEYDGIFLVGGNGALEHLNTSEMHKILAEFFALQKPYGAICISPCILASAQLLKNKKATCWNGDGRVQEHFNTHNVTFVDEPVVVDGNVVTANGPRAAAAFGKAIITVLQKD